MWLYGSLHLSSHTISNFAEVMKVISMIRDKISFGHDINDDDSGDEDDD